MTIAARIQEKRQYGNIRNPLPKYQRPDTYVFIPYKEDPEIGRIPERKSHRSSAGYPAFSNWLDGYDGVVSSGSPRDNKTRTEKHAGNNTTFGDDDVWAEWEE